MPTYRTLDNLPDLTALSLANARALAFSSTATASSRASYSTSVAAANPVFRWEGTAGTTYSFTSTSFFDPTAIVVYDNLGNAVAVDTESYQDAYGTDTLAGFVAPYTGTFLVNAGWSQGSYYTNASLTITVGANATTTPTGTSPAVDDYADSTRTTGSVAIGGQVTGNIETANDKDWFRVSLAAGTLYAFELLGADGRGGTLGSGTGLSSPYLRVYNGAGLYQTASASGGTGGDPLVSFIAPTSGTYYLGVDELFGTGTGTYTLRASASTRVDDYAATTSTTGSVPVGGQATGTIEGSGDIDWFRVSVTAGTAYTFELRGADSAGGTLGAGFAEAYLSLYDALGRYLTATANGGVAGDPLLTYTPTASGNLYLGVQDLMSSGSGTYTLLAKAAITVDDFAGSTLSSGTVVPGGSVAGRVETVGDADWFGVTLMAGQVYTISLNGAGTSGLYDPYLRVHNSSGLLLDYDDNSGSGLNAQLTFAPTASGRYYLAASSASGWTLSSLATGGYTLALSNGVTAVVDDYAASPLTTGSVAIGGQASGVIERVGDVDWLRVSLTAGTRYTFELQGADSGGGTLGNGFAEAYLSLYDSNGWYVSAAANGGTAGDPLISFTPWTSSTYYLAVSDLMGSGTGTYTVLTSSTRLDDYPADRSTTGAVLPGGNVSGRVEMAGDADWFAVDLLPGQSYTVNLNSSTSAGLPDPYLRLHGPSGDLLRYDDDSGVGLNAQLSFVPSAAGRYYLGVSSAGLYGTGTGGYTLAVSQPTVIVDDYAAGTATLGAAVVGGQVSGRIETAGDTDWFRVSLVAGTTYTIDLATAGSAGLSDPYLRFYSSAGTLLWSDDDGGVGLNARGYYTPTSTGSYYLEASGVSTTLTGGYSLSVAASAADDFLASPATSGRVSPGSSVTGTLEAAGDHDWFAISLVAGTRYELNLSGTTGSAGLYDPYLRLLGSSGTQLASDDDSGAGLSARLVYTPGVSGTYYVDASSASFFSQTTGSYTLAVAAVAADDYAATTATTGRAVVAGTVTGRIEADGDSDWFGVALTAGNTYTLQLNAAASGGLADPYLRLYSSSGATLSSDDDSGVGANALLTFTPATTGTYYLGASSSPLAPGLTGDYALTISSVTAAAPSPTAASGFNIAVRFSGDTQYQSVFTAAAARWQSVISSDLPDVQSALYGSIDDLMISARVIPIDGISGVLGRAAPTGLRSGSGLPYAGFMEFDVADMAQMASDGTLQDVIIHEMGHVLGLGTLWSGKGLVDPADSSRYTGQYALSAWRTLSGDLAATHVPLETSGGRGTAGVHWSEATFDQELMTGYADLQMSISIVTVGGLADLGYSVNYAMADPYTLG